MSRVWWRTASALVLLGLVAVAFLVRAFWPLGPVAIIVSPQTTYLTGPLRADGTADYFAAVDSILREGVTPENNAAIPLVRALGPKCLDEKTRGAVLEALGLAGLPENGEYLVPLEDDAKVHGLEADESKAMEYARVDEWLEANRKPIDLAVEASRREMFYLPMVSPSDPPRLLYCISAAARTLLIRSFFAPLQSRAARRLALNDVAGAWSDALAHVRLGFLAGQDWTIAMQMAATGAASYGSRACIEIATSGKVASRDARTWIANISSLPQRRSLAELYKFERLLVLDTLSSPMEQTAAMTQDGQDSSPANQYSLDPNVMLREVNLAMDLPVGAIGKKSWADQLAGLQSAEKTFDGYSSIVPDWRFKLRALLSSSAERRVLESKIVAWILVGGSLRSLGRTAQAIIWTDMHVDLARAALALAAYRSEHGSYPSALSSLVPEYLRAEPVDLYNDQPLIYRLEGSGYRLYSVGLDRVDNGGREGEMDGIVVLQK